MDAIQHIRHLCQQIGPRGSTTPQEAAAAGYAADILRKAGLEAVTEPFTSARSSYYPYALFAGLMLLGEVFFLAGGRWGAGTALVLGVVALASVLLELAFRGNLLRWLLPVGRSQNVWARIPPRGAVRQHVVVMAHLDSHRTPLLFSSPGWLRLFKTLVPLGLVSAVLLMLCFALGLAGGGIGWRSASLPFALVLLVMFVLILQADFSPYSPGANDNATGVGAVLSLAQRLGGQPLEHTNVWTVLSGCEEVGCYGAAAFARAHRGELGRPIWITLDGVGGAGSTVGYIRRETFLLTSPSDAALVALAERVAARHPEWDARGHDFMGAYTEGVIGAQQGFRVLTLLNIQRDGTLPGWHRPSDTLEHLDPTVVEHTEAFLWELLAALDGEA